MKRVILTAAIMAWGLVSAIGAEADRQAADEAAIRKAVESYVAAFNQGDAKALAAMWSPEAVYTNPLSGEQVVGREAIEQQFAAIFADAKGAKLEAKTDSVQFVSPSVGIEHGTAKVMVPDQAPEETEYTAVYVKRDDQWLLDRVTEEEVLVVPSHCSFGQSIAARYRCVARPWASCRCTLRRRRTNRIVRSSASCWCTQPTGAGGWPPDSWMPPPRRPAGVGSHC